MRARKPRIRMNLSRLDESEKASIREVLGDLPELDKSPVLYGFEKALSSSPTQLVGDRIPFISEEALDFHRKKYTRTGAYAYGPVKRANKAIPDSLLAGIPHVADISSVDQYKDGPYRVFINMKTGQVQASISSYDVKALTFYRRYYSLYPAPITEMKGSDVVKLASEIRNSLLCDGESLCWLPKDEYRAFLYSERHIPINSDHNWQTVQVPVSFVPVKDGVPENLNPHYVLAHNFRYGTHKVR